MAASSVLRWKSLVEKYARKYGVPLPVALGIMDIESGGNPEARSKAGAMGLMQVMPSNFARGENGMDPETNIRKGVEMLASRYKIYGNWNSAAASYFGAVDARGNPTSARDANGVSGLDYVREFNAAVGTYKGGTMNGTDDDYSLNADPGGVGSAGGEVPDAIGGGGDYSGVDSSVRDMFVQLQSEKKKVDEALKAWNADLAAAKAEQQRNRPMMNQGGFWVFSGGAEQEARYADILERIKKAESQVQYYKTASQQLIDSLQGLNTQYLRDVKDSANKGIQYAKDAATAKLQGEKDRLSDAIALGRLNTEQAKLAWDQAKTVTNDWMTAIQQGYSAASQLMPKLAMQEDVDALWEDINRMGAGTRYGGVTGKAPRVIPLEAILTPYMDAIKQYMPPMNAIDWKKAMTVPEGIPELPISKGEYEEAAVGKVQKPMAIAPLPPGGFIGGEPEMPPSLRTDIPQGTLGTQEGLQPGPVGVGEEGGATFQGEPWMPGPGPGPGGMGTSMQLPDVGGYYGRTSYDELLDEMNRMGGSGGMPEEEEEEEEGIGLLGRPGVPGVSASPTPTPTPTPPSAPSPGKWTITSPELPPPALIEGPGPGSPGARIGETLGGVLDLPGRALGALGSNWQSAYGGRPETPLQEWYRLHPGQVPPPELRLGR